jgi:hypothetical protein
VNKAGYVHKKMLKAGLPVGGVGWNADETIRVDWEKTPTQEQIDQANAIIAAYDSVEDQKEAIIARLVPAEAMRLAAVSLEADGVDVGDAEYEDEVDQLKDELEALEE